jgi:bacteriocin-like protein
LTGIVKNILMHMLANYSGAIQQSARHVERTQRRGSVMRELDEKELDHVSGGDGKNWTTENPGDQPHGASAVTHNGGGNAPEGKNKDLPPGIDKQT